MKNIILVLLVLLTHTLFSQASVGSSKIPPPPCYANGNSGFGGSVGEGLILSSDPNDIVEFNMSTNGNEMNDILVFYIDTGAPGRNVIDLSIDDSLDSHRVAISNSNISDFGSVIQFPTGFEASYAVAINTDFAGLWSIPATGTVGDNGLNFINSVNSTLTSNLQLSYQFSFDWADIGLTETDIFNFVGVYVSSSGYSSDEGYGSGIVSGTQGADDLIFNGYLSFPQCDATLSDVDSVLDNTITVKYFDNQLFIKGLNDITKICVYDIIGREIYNEKHKINDTQLIPLKLIKNELQFIVIESSNIQEVLKVIPD